MRHRPVAARQFGFLTQYWPMVLMTLDETTLSALLAMGGEDLRLQLLHDLSRIEGRISPLCCAPPSGATMSSDQLRHLLHEMRGIAVTVGASKLAQACAAAEADTVALPVEAMSSQLSEVVDDCKILRAQIAQHPMKPA